MLFRVEFKPRAIKDLKSLSSTVANRILRKINALQDNLHGDIKKLTNHSPDYRLRVGEYRVLFESCGDNRHYLPHCPPPLSIPISVDHDRTPYPNI